MSIFLNLFLVSHFMNVQEDARNNKSIESGLMATNVVISKIRHMYLPPNERISVLDIETYIILFCKSGMETLVLVR